MKLINLVCPSCGAKLKVNSNKKEFICDYCDTTSVLDNSIKENESKVSDVKQIKNKVLSKVLPIFVFIALLLGMAIFPYIPMNLFGFNYESFSTTMKAIYMLLCDIGFMLVVFLIYKDKVIKDFKDFFKNFFSNFELAFKYYFLGLLIMVVSNTIITFFISDAVAGNEESIRDMIDTIPFYMIFTVSIYAPFIEELIFRHSIKDCVMCYGNNKITKGIYIFISGFIFAAMHILGQTTSLLDYVYIVPYLSLGITFSALYSKTDNIFSTISIHSLHNTFAIILYLLAGGGL